jgi:hypothetical protein
VPYFDDQAPRGLQLLAWPQPRPPSLDVQHARTVHEQQADRHRQPQRQRQVLPTAGVLDPPQPAERGDDGDGRDHSGWRCCVAPTRRCRMDHVGSRSDREGQFVERDGYSLARVVFNRQLVVSASNVLDECMPGHDHAGAAVLLEPSHWS